jgi:hypothetical protein
MAKKDKPKKGRKGGDIIDVDVDAEIVDTRASVAKHPRARRSIRTIKGWTGLAAFILVEYQCLHGGMPFDQALVRALLAGIVAYLVAWLVAVVVWRQLVVAEIEAFRVRLIEQAEQEAAEEAAVAAATPPTAVEPSFS